MTPDTTPKLSTPQGRDAVELARRFPILPDGEPISGNKRRKDLLASVPWSIVAPHERQAQKNHGGQTLARLAERQGLSFGELAAVLEDREWRPMPDVEALATIACAMVKHITALDAQRGSLEATGDDVQEAVAQWRDRNPDAEFGWLDLPNILARANLRIVKDGK